MKVFFQKCVVFAKLDTSVLLRPFSFIVPEDFWNYLAFQSFDHEHIWWWLSQKPVMRTKLDIYVLLRPFGFLFLKTFEIIWLFNLLTVSLSLYIFIFIAQYGIEIHNILFTTFTSCYLGGHKPLFMMLTNPYNF